MNFEYLYYFTELVKDMNMTQTATRLFISQQTLSNYIIRLENHYGVKLFIRGQKLILTDAGKELLQFAKYTLDNERSMRAIFSDITEQRRGQIRFGGSHLRATRLIPMILTKFSNEFPQVTIDVLLENSKRLIQLVTNGDLDLALCLIDVLDSKLNYTLLYEDRCYLCISERLLKRHYSNKEIEIIKSKSKKRIALKDFERIPFYIMNSANHIGLSLADCFEESNFKPQIYLSSRSDAFGAPICNMGITASFMSQSRLVAEWDQLADDINIFPVYFKNEPLKHNLYLAEKESKYTLSYVDYLKTLIVEYYKTLTSDDLSRMV